jgi:hypothetical protein
MKSEESRWEVRDHISSPDAGNLYVWDSQEGDGLAGTTILGTHPTREAAQAEVIRLTKLPVAAIRTVKEAVNLFCIMPRNAVK